MAKTKTKNPNATAKPSMKLETITPAKAKAWNAGPNRSVRKRRVALYAASMANKDWDINGETIVFDANGNLIDGQHRLLGCVEAGVPFTSWVARGVPRSSFQTMDQGASRSAGDILHTNGDKYYSQLASALTYLWRLETTGSVNSTIPIPPKTLMRIRKANPLMCDSCQLTGVNNLVGIPTGFFACCHFLMHRTQATRADQFVESVCDGTDLASDSPAYALREKITRQRKSSNQVDFSPSIKRALIIKAMNAYYTKQPLTIGGLRYTKSEVFPAIKFAKLPKPRDAK